MRGFPESVESNSNNSKDGSGCKDEGGRQDDRVRRRQ